MVMIYAGLLFTAVRNRGYYFADVHVVDAVFNRVHEKLSYNYLVGGGA